MNEKEYIKKLLADALRIKQINQELQIELDNIEVIRQAERIAEDKSC